MSVSITALKYDNESAEATVQISYGDISVVVFSHPFDSSSISSPIALDALFVENIHQVDHFCLPQKTEHGYYSYHITAKVFDRGASQVKLNGISLSLDEPLPKDIPNGAYVAFDVGRLDLRLATAECV